MSVTNYSKVDNIEELIGKVTSDEFDKFSVSSFRSDIPEKCVEQACILGVDEAGRGPVLGPMVYAICYCPVTELDVIKSIGCTDSKALTEKKREEIFGLINNNSHCLGWAADVISPNFICNKMLKRTKHSLNEVAQDSTIRLINDLLKSVTIKEIFVDTIGPPDKYQVGRQVNGPILKKHILIF